MEFLKALDISLSGMRVQKVNIDILAENIANVDTILTKEGGFYKAKRVIFEEVLDKEGKASGVKVKDIITEKSDGILRYEPGNPYADENGYVKYPDINIANELIKMVNAQRVYEANLSVASVTKKLILKTLEI